MINKHLILGSLAILIAGSVGAYESTQAKLERGVREAQSMVERASFDGKPVTADLRRQEAQQRLAKAQSELDAFKTAGPAAYEQARLEAAIKQDQRVLEQGIFDGKPVTADLRRQEARAKLAKDQAALEAFKTAGPAGVERARLQDAVKHDRWVIATGGGESKMIQRDARIKAAREDLSEHEAALAALQ